MIINNIEKITQIIELLSTLKYQTLIRAALPEDRGINTALQVFMRELAQFLDEFLVFIQKILRDCRDNNLLNTAIVFSRNIQSILAYSIKIIQLSLKVTDLFLESSDGFLLELLNGLQNINNHFLLLAQGAIETTYALPYDNRFKILENQLSKGFDGVSIVLNFLSNETFQKKELLELWHFIKDCLDFYQKIKKENTFDVQALGQLYSYFHNFFKDILMEFFIRASRIETELSFKAFYFRDLLIDIFPELAIELQEVAKQSYPYILQAELISLQSFLKKYQSETNLKRDLLYCSGIIDCIIQKKAVSDTDCRGMLYFIDSILRGNPKIFSMDDIQLNDYYNQENIANIFQSECIPVFSFYGEGLSNVTPTIYVLKQCIDRLMKNTEEKLKRMDVLPVAFYRIEKIDALEKEIIRMAQADSVVAIEKESITMQSEFSQNLGKILYSQDVSNDEDLSIDAFQNFCNSMEDAYHLKNLPVSCHGYNENLSLVPILQIADKRREMLLLGIKNLKEALFDQSRMHENKGFLLNHLTEVEKILKNVFLYKDFSFAGIDKFVLDIKNMGECCLDQVSNKALLYNSLTFLIDNVTHFTPAFQFILSNENISEIVSKEKRDKFFLFLRNSASYFETIYEGVGIENELPEINKIYQFFKKFYDEINKPKISIKNTIISFFVILDNIYNESLLDSIKKIAQKACQAYQRFSKLTRDIVMEIYYFLREIEITQGLKPGVLTNILDEKIKFLNNILGSSSCGSRPENTDNTQTESEDNNSNPIGITNNSTNYPLTVLSTRLDNPCFFKFNSTQQNSPKGKTKNIFFEKAIFNFFTFLKFILNELAQIFEAAQICKVAQMVNFTGVANNFHNI